MSVENFDDIGGITEFLDERMPETCLYCGKFLSGLTVYWHGAEGQSVALHPECGLQFAARLSRDSINAKLLGEGKSATAGVSLGLQRADTS